MFLTVNFARTTSQRRRQQEKLDLKFFKLVLLGLGATFLVFVSLFVAKTLLAKKLVVLKTKEAKLTQQWENLKLQEMAYAVYIQKVKILAQLFNFRQEKQQALKKFRSFFDQGAKVVGLKYSVDTQEIMFQIRSESIFVLQKVIEKLDSSEIKQDFGTVSKDRISRSEDGGYVLGVRVKLDNSKKE